MSPPSMEEVLKDLAEAVRENTRMQRVFWDNLPAKKRAELLGVHPETERRRRRKEQARALVGRAR